MFRGNPFVRFYLIALLAFVYSGCKKHQEKPINPVDQLPTATQSGAQTLGFLLNGKPWTPAGNNGYPRLAASYDETYKDGALNISCHWILSDSQREYFSFGADSIQAAGSITKEHRDFGFHYSTIQGCDYFSDDDVNCQDTLQITKLDKTKGIVSGTFSCLLIKPGCDTIRITDGRFDVLF